MLIIRPERKEMLEKIPLGAEYAENDRLHDLLMAIDDYMIDNHMFGDPAFELLPAGYTWESFYDEVYYDNVSNQR